MNVAWAMFWGGSRSTKPCVFPCKVAAAGDERYLVCAAGTRANAVAIRPCDFLRFAVDFELLDLHALSNVSAASTATNACVLQSANLRNLLERKVEEEGNLESRNLMVDIGFEEMAALKHSLKIALARLRRVAKFTVLRVQTKYPNRGAQEYWFGLLQIWTLRWLFRSLDNCLHGTRRYLGRTTLRCPDR